MKLIAILAVGVAVCCSANAQTAKVIALDDATAQHIKALYDEKAPVEAEIAKFTADITDSYTTRNDDRTYIELCAIGATPKKVTQNCGNVQHYREPLPGWEYGFEFSEDFKFIVPKKVPSLTYASGWGNSYVTPASGIPGTFDLTVDESGHIHDAVPPCGIPGTFATPTTSGGSGIKLSH